MLLVFYQYFNQLAVLTERERKGTNFFFPSKFFFENFLSFFFLIFQLQQYNQSQISDNPTITGILQSVTFFHLF